MATLDHHLKTVTEQVDQRVPQNQALTINDKKGKFHLTALKAADKPDTVKTLKDLIESRLPKVDLVDTLIDIDNQTNFVRHFLRGKEQGLSPAERRRNVLAALLAIGCNIGCKQMALASGLNFHEITFVADWFVTEDALKAATIDIINFAFRASDQPEMSLSTI